MKEKPKEILVVLTSAVFVSIVYVCLILENLSNPSFWVLALLVFPFMCFLAGVFFAAVLAALLLKNTTTLFYDV